MEVEGAVAKGGEGVGMGCHVSPFLIPAVLELRAPGSLCRRTPRYTSLLELNPKCPPFSRHLMRLLPESV